MRDIPCIRRILHYFQVQSILKYIEEGKTKLQHRIIILSVVIIRIGYFEVYVILALSYSTLMKPRKKEKLFHHIPTSFQYICILTFIPIRVVGTRLIRSNENFGISLDHEITGCSDCSHLIPFPVYEVSRRIGQIM